MNLKPAVLVMLLLALTVGMQSNAAARDTKKSLVSVLVQNLGYGAAIHNFKNYVLRANDKYRVNAEQHFAEAEKTITNLRNTGELDAKELAAVAKISQMIDGYQAGLPVIQELYASNLSKVRILKRIDTEIRVDDGAAIAALEQLRKPHSWNRVDDAEHALGYGGAIHNFKNFVIRGQTQYQNRAAAKFQTAHESLVQLAEDNALSDEEKNALNNVNRVVVQYSQALPIVDGTWSQARNTQMEALISMTITAADRVVKINDTPAIDGLSVLRAHEVN